MKKIKAFDAIYERAAKRKGGEVHLNTLIEVPVKTPKQLIATQDDRYLAAISKAVFKAGFVWRVIDNKWDGFEQAFWHFNLKRCAWISAEDIECLSQDVRIVRNRQKIFTVQKNATMLTSLVEQHGSVGHFMAQWPEDDLIGLLNYFKSHGARLGGMSCQYFLRSVGKDSFVLSNDVVAALIDAGIIDKTPTSKTALNKVQAIFNQWREESLLGYAQISRVLACSIDAV